MLALIGLGSNTGDRAESLRAAAVAIGQALDAEPQVSQPVETPPWGYASPHPYLNAVLAVDTGLDPRPLLALLLDIERRIGGGAPHRLPDGSYCDRPIDIDLLALGDVAVTAPGLQVPHPRMHLRRFVLEPMACVAPKWRHPLLGLTASQMLDALEP